MSLLFLVSSRSFSPINQRKETLIVNVCKYKYVVHYPSCFSIRYTSYDPINATTQTYLFINLKSRPIGDLSYTPKCTYTCIFAHTQEYVFNIHARHVHICIYIHVVVFIVNFCVKDSKSKNHSSDVTTFISFFLKMKAISSIERNTLHCKLVQIFSLSFSLSLSNDLSI